MIRKEMRRKIFKKKNFLFLLLTNCLVVSLWFSNLKVQSLIDHLRHVPWLPLLSRGQAVPSLAHVQCLWEWSLQEEKKVMLKTVYPCCGDLVGDTLWELLFQPSLLLDSPNKSTKSAEFSNVKHILLSFCCCLVTVVSTSFATTWTLACRTPLSMRFPRQEYWSGLLFLPPGNLLDPGKESPALAGQFFVDAKWCCRKAIVTFTFILSSIELRKEQQWTKSLPPTRSQNHENPS